MADLNGNPPVGPEGDGPLMVDPAVLQRALDDAREAARIAAENRPLKEIGAPTANNVRLGVNPPQARRTRDLFFNPSLIALIQQNQFSGNPTEDANKHLQRFLRNCITLNLEEVAPDIIRLTLFPFSLRDQAEDWLNSFNSNPFTCWDDLAKSFLERFYPRIKTTSIVREIIGFKQESDENLFEAWERFKDLLRMCPHHDIGQDRLICSFYDGLNHQTRQSVNSTAGGSLLDLGCRDAKALIESMASSQTNWSVREKNSKGGMIEVDKSTHLQAQLDALTTMMKEMKTRPVEAVQKCQFCEEEGHTAKACYLVARDEPVADVNAIMAPPPYAPQNYVYRDKRNHPGLSYGNTSGCANPGQAQPPPQNKPNNNAVGNNNQVNYYQQHRNLVDKFMADQTEWNHTVFDEMKQVRESLQFLIQQSKLANPQNQGALTKTGMFPSQPEVNPNGEVKSVTHRLRSGTEYVGPKNPDESVPGQVQADPPEAQATRQKKMQKNMAVRTISGDPPEILATRQDDAQNAELSGQFLATRQDSWRPARKDPEAQKDKIKAPIQTRYAPEVPFPERLAKAKEEKEYGKFMEIMKQIQISIPFTDMLTKMPSYAKFLKDILTNKKKIEDVCIAVTHESKSVSTKKLPPKLKDPGRFTIPCKIGEANIKRALLDLGASVSLMPESIFNQLGVGELRTTRMTLQLADRSTRLPLGIVEDVPIQVGDIVVPCDFVIVDMEEDPEVPIILGRPFLATAGILINCRNGKMLVKVGDETVEFEVEKAMKLPNQVDTCCMVDMLDEIVQEEFNSEVTKAYTYPIDNQEEWDAYVVSLEEEPEAEEEVDVLRTVSGDPPEILATRQEASPVQPKLNLKPLPSNLQYQYLGPDETYPVIESAHLNSEEIEKLLKELRLHRKAIGYTIDDLKGLDPNTWLLPLAIQGAAIPDAPMQQSPQESMQGSQPFGQYGISPYQMPPFAMQPFQGGRVDMGGSSSSTPPHEEFSYASLCASLNNLARLSSESNELGKRISDKCEAIKRDERENEVARGRVNEMYDWFFPIYGQPPPPPPQ
ncbi:F7F22.17 [Rhynchospora pubera]|uniref:F7F22.17 n=1 Tax=Rhynchospora pubera TaxID=906938 RepID=A0AAV8GKB5_9POAL|nr:F7F22.17 [Rhynchospora pubera]